MFSPASVRTELSLRIFERLKAENIEIPFPQRDLNIKLGDDGEVSVTVICGKALMAGEGLKGAASPPNRAGAGETPKQSAPASQRRPQSKGRIRWMTVGGGEGDR
jgi:potassium efflux system protein